MSIIFTRLSTIIYFLLSDLILVFIVIISVAFDKFEKKLAPIKHLLAI